LRLIYSMINIIFFHIQDCSTYKDQLSQMSFDVSVLFYITCMMQNRVSEEKTISEHPGFTDVTLLRDSSFYKPRSLIVFFNLAYLHNVKEQKQAWILFTQDL